MYSRHSMNTALTSPSPGAIVALPIRCARFHWRVSMERPRRQHENRAAEEFGKECGSPVHGRPFPPRDLKKAAIQ